MATKQQIPVLAARLTEFQEEFSILSTEDAQWVIVNGKDAVVLCAKAIANRTMNLSLSDVVSKTALTMTTGVFVPSEKFHYNSEPKQAVKISQIGSNFQSYFMKKTEEAFGGGIIYGREVIENTNYKSVFNELNSHQEGETTLYEIFSMISLQPGGEKGNLLNNGFSNIFYAYDIFNILSFVKVYWHSNGWSIESDSNDRPLNPGVDCRVFSHGLMR